MNCLTRRIGAVCCATLTMCLLVSIACPSVASTLTLTSPSANHKMYAYPDPSFGYPNNTYYPPAPLTLTAEVFGLPPAPPGGGTVTAHINGMTFTINGTNFSVPIANFSNQNTGSPSGTYYFDISSAPNPTQFSITAQAAVTISTSNPGYPPVPPTLVNETTSTPTWYFMVGDIGLKDMNWMNTASSIYDFQNGVNMSGVAKPNYYGYDATGNQYHNPVV